MSPADLAILEERANLGSLPIRTKGQSNVRPATVRRGRLAPRTRGQSEHPDHRLRETVPVLAHALLARFLQARTKAACLDASSALRGFDTIRTNRSTFRKENTEQDVAIVRGIALNLPGWPQTLPAKFVVAGLFYLKTPMPASACGAFADRSLGSEEK